MGDFSICKRGVESARGYGLARPWILLEIGK
jgi:hypothetical protein